MSRVLFIALIVIALVVFWRGGESVRVEAWKRLLLLAFVLGVIVTIANPEITTWVAEQIGIGRGTDLVTYLTAIALFVLVLNTYIRMRRADRQIAKLTRALALREYRRDHLKR